MVERLWVGITTFDLLIAICAISLGSTLALAKAYTAGAHSLGLVTGANGARLLIYLTCSITSYMAMYSLSLS